MIGQDYIRLENMIFYGRHGVLAEENRLGQKFSVDIKMFLDLRTASSNDDLTSSVDYSLVYTVSFLHVSCQM